ncbi:MAG: AMP-binding protein [Flavobacteriales bacterium]
MAAGFNIVSLFFHQASKSPKRLAIVDKREQIDFEDLADEVCMAAAHFLAKGIKPGDRVLVFVPMSVRLYVKVLALFYIGATAVFLDEWVNRDRLNVCCKIADCKGFIAPWYLRVPAFFLSKEVRRIPIWFSEKKVVGPKAERSFGIDANTETALITFTTGSTGTPKAAKRTHDFLKAQFDVLQTELDPIEGEVDMPVLPIVLMLNLGFGVTSVIADWKSSKPTEMDPNRIWQQIERYSVNRLTSSPYFLLRLSQYVRKSGKNTEVIKKLFTGGAPVFPREAEQYLLGFPTARISVVYGSTESEPISAIDARLLIAQQAASVSIGLPVGDVHPKTALRIISWKDDVIEVDEQGFVQMELASGEIGEIVVAGPHVLREYFNNPEALRRNKIFIGEKCWHRTGDSGFVDALGKLYLTGRCKQLFEENGQLYSPFILENLVRTILGVRFGTVMKRDGVVRAYLEVDGEFDAVRFQNVMADRGLNTVEIIEMNSIPRDKRHFSKIDYDRL